MKVTMEDLKNGWYDVSIGLKRVDVKELINLLNSLLNTKGNQHFHLESNYSGKGGIGDIEIYLDEDDASDNISFTSLAISPE